MTWKKFGIGIGIIIAIIILAYTFLCERIDPGNVGLIVHLSGSDNGTMEVEMGPQRIFYNPLITNVIEYPVSVQTAQFTQDTNEYSPSNEEMTFNSNEGLSIKCDVSVSWRLSASKADRFYMKYRATTLNVFTRGYMKDIIRNALNSVGTEYKVEDLYGGKKENFRHDVELLVNSMLDTIGVNIEQLGFIGDMRPPENVKKALNDKVAATQRAMMAENELRLKEAEVAKSVAQAKGEAESKIAEAEGIAKSNALISQSITPQLLEWQRIEIQKKWNGVLPMVQLTSPSSTLLQLPTINK